MKIRKVVLKILGGLIFVEPFNFRVAKHPRLTPVTHLENIFGKKLFHLSYNVLGSVIVFDSDYKYSLIQESWLIQNACGVCQFV